MNQNQITDIENNRVNRAKAWVLTYRRSGRTRRFTSLEAARPAHRRAAARYGTRWLSLRPER